MEATKAEGLLEMLQKCNGNLDVVQKASESGRWTVFIRRNVTTSKALVSNSFLLLLVRHLLLLAWHLLLLAF